MDEKSLWEKCVKFHGHECPGLTIGYKASLYAIKLLDITFDKNEDLYCISENDACGVDAIQVILGCSIGKGHLLFHMTGKSVYSFYNRTNGKSVRVSLNPLPHDMEKTEALKYYHSLELEKMFSVSETRITIPERPKIFSSFVCEKCGEKVGSNWVRFLGDKKVCIDCASKYDRFNI